MFGALSVDNTNYSGLLFGVCIRPDSCRLCQQTVYSNIRHYVDLCSCIACEKWPEEGRYLPNTSDIPSSILSQTYSVGYIS